MKFPGTKKGGYDNAKLIGCEEIKPVDSLINLLCHIF